MIWDKSAECMSANDRRERQGTALRQLVHRMYRAVPAYRKKMADKGVTPEDIRSIADLPKLPFTTKDDLRDGYPFGLFAVPNRQIVRLHASSGTTGRATVVGYTPADIRLWSELVARCLVSAGVGADDVIQVAYGYGLFTGGLGLHYGAEQLGATVIPISGGNTRRQVQLMQDFGTTVLACTPSYALYLAETLREMKIPRSDLRLRVGVFGAEPWTEGMRREIEEQLGITAVDIYGLSEIMGPGVACECTERVGLHVQDDHFVPEVIDPDTGQPLEPGKRGELVFTTLTKEGLPLIRYRTHDLTELDLRPCRCGRTTTRMSKCMARTDDMLIIRGVNVFPSQIEAVLLEISELAPHYLLVLERERNLDKLTLQVEVNERVFSDSIVHLETFTNRVRAALESALGLSLEVKLVEPRTIGRSEGKAKRVLDKRKLV
ncbi:MAG TPA: phenylacetate--CoA ligase [Burkholderiales bacterium]|nr:phenylacetate--CoA ligase [Burkholderiales bacterium]